MKNSNLNKPIIFSDKKTELERKHKISKLYLSKLHDTKIIGYEEHRRIKIHEAKKEKILNSKIYKARKKITSVLIVLFSLLAVTFLWNKFHQPSYTGSTNSKFKVENKNLSSSDKSTYSSIIKESVQSILNIKYPVILDEIHKNGDLILGKGYFTIPNEGNVNFDIIIKDYKPCSLTVNGEEYIKK